MTVFPSLYKYQVSRSVSICRCHIKRHLTKLSKQFRMFESSINWELEWKFMVVCNIYDGNLFWCTSWFMQTMQDADDKVIDTFFPMHTWSKYYIDRNTWYRFAINFSKLFLVVDVGVSALYSYVVISNAPFVLWSSLLFFFCFCFIVWVINIHLDILHK